MKTLLSIAISCILVSCTKSGYNSSALNGNYEGTFQRVLPSFAVIPPQKIQLRINNGAWNATPNDTVIANGSVTIGINQGRYQVSGDSVAFTNTISLPMIPYPMGFTILLNNKYVMQQKSDSLFLSVLSKDGFGEIYALKRR